MEAMDTRMRWILAAAAWLWALTALSGWIGVRLFDREHILTKWT